MAFFYGDRVKETSLTAGLAPMALGGPTLGFQGFNTGVGIGNECFYGIVDTVSNDWEMGRGTVGVGTLSRDTVIASSNSNLPVMFAANQKIVFTTIPSEFYANALDSTAHEAIDHTLAPFNLLNTTAHEGIDHTAAPFSLLATANLPAEHATIDHTSAPFNLLTSGVHELIDHKAAPFSLLDAAAHGSINHYSVITSAIPQVSGPEKTAGTSTFLRSYSPQDVADMAGIHGGGPSGGKIVGWNYGETPGVVICSTTAFQDNTIPTTSEGNLVVTTPSYTPLSTSNFLELHYSCSGGTNLNTRVICFMVRDAGPNAFFAQQVEHVGSEITDISIRTIIPVADLSAQTYSIYMGVTAGGNFTVNGWNGAPLFGGTMRATLSIKELAP